MEKKKKKKGFGLGCRASVHDAFAKRRLGLRLTEIVVLVRVLRRVAVDLEIAYGIMIYY